MTIMLNCHFLANHAKRALATRSALFKRRALVARRPPVERGALVQGSTLAQRWTLSEKFASCSNDTSFLWTGYSLSHDSTCVLALG